MHTGDQVTCRITETGSWGAYAETNQEETVYINFNELSWSRIRTTEEVVNVGDRVQLQIMDAPTYERACYLGSLKRVVSAERPDFPEAYQVGSFHQATVERLGRDILFARLPQGPIVGVRLPESHRLQPGDQIRIILTSVDSECNRIIAELTFATADTKTESGAAE